MLALQYYQLVLPGVALVKEPWQTEFITCYVEVTPYIVKRFIAWTYVLKRIK